MRIHDRVAEQLGIRIVSGDLPPGSTLPKELEVGKELSVSRAAYREAVRILAAKGLVKSQQKVGTVVLPRERWSLLDPDVLAWMFRSEPDPKYIRDLFELRAIIEPAAAQLAAERRNAEQLSRMGHALERMAAHAVDSTESINADVDFHSAILEASDNEAIRAMTKTISAAVNWSVIYNLQGKHELHDHLPDHRSLFESIVDGDSVGAREAALQLIELALEDTRRNPASSAAVGRNGPSQKIRP